jgi:hypothetical protein
MQVSHETIYRSLFIQTRGVLKKELMAHLRTARQMRQAKGGTTKSGLGQIVDTVSIRERPAEAEDRAVPGHWEGDLLSGASNTHIVTLVERHSDRPAVIWPEPAPRSNSARIGMVIDKRNVRLKDRVIVYQFAAFGFRRAGEHLRQARYGEGMVETTTLGKRHPRKGTTVLASVMRKQSDCCGRVSP